MISMWAVPIPGDADRWGQFVGWDLVLHFHDMSGDVHLREDARQNRAGENDCKNANIGESRVLFGKPA